MDYRAEPDITSASEIYTEYCYARYQFMREKILREEVMRHYEMQVRDNHTLLNKLSTLESRAKASDIRLDAAAILDEKEKAYIIYLEGQLQTISNQMEQRAIFHPLEARITINPVIKMREESDRQLAQRKAKLLNA